MKNLSASLRLCVVILLVAVGLLAQTRDFTRHVNPFIGTGGHGHTFPGATVPFGMVQLSPDTRIDNWDGSSGYHYSDDTIYGFSHTHLSGTGIPDGCDILFMPTVKDMSSAKWGRVPREGYPTKFSHEKEKAEPGYYSVKLEGSNILAEMTSTKRVGFHRYTFPKSDRGFTRALIALDLLWRDKHLDSEIRWVTGRRLEGFRKSSSWAKNQTVYFVFEFSKPVTALLGARGDAGSTGDENLKVRRDFDLGPISEEPILLKVAISYVSIEGARKNLEAELAGWDFDKVRADAKAAWNKELSKIEVSGGTPEQTTNFYTALYHTMIQPNVFNDVDGRYKGHDGKIHQLPGYGAVRADARRSYGGDLDPRPDSSAMPSDVRRSYASPEGANKFTSGYAAEDRRHSRDGLYPTSRKGTAFPHIGGQSPNPKSKIPNPKSDHYTVFSLWDTFRAAHPLYTIIDQKRTVDFINTFIRIYEQGGRLPVWELWGEETDTMIGYHAVSVIADAMAKGIKGFDYEKAYQAAKHSAELDHFGLAAYKKRGYISMEDENESVSKTLEYAYNDWCIAQMARNLSDTKSAKIPNLKPGETTTIRGRDIGFVDLLDKVAFEKRARNFENLFDTKTGFFRPKKNGGFVEPFAPNEVTFGFTEGNSWQYSFFVPQDLARLMELMGGREKFVAKLDELLTTDQKLAGREQADLTGLIGQYAHGNEPSHHITYLYNYAGEPWKTQKYVGKIMNEFYKNAPDGLIGNEDCGQMSAWYVMSAGGFYPVSPGSPVYAFGTPLFPEMTYRLENGKTFTIRAKDVSSKKMYIAGARLNGVPHKKAFITHDDMMHGGVLEFDMTDVPFKTAFAEFPVSSVDSEFVAVPTVQIDKPGFNGQAVITLSSPTPGVDLYFIREDIKEYHPPAPGEPLYLTDAVVIEGYFPLEQAIKYTGPFPIRNSARIKAIAVRGKNVRSRTVEAEFRKRPNDWTVKVVSGYSTQYTGGGENSIIDGIRGTVNFASGEWQGVQGKPFEAIIDLKRETGIRELGAGFLQVAGPWIWMPDRVEFETSNDGTNFLKVAEIRPGFPQREMTPTIKEFTQAITPTKARYVRIRAFNFGKIPGWHPGAGGDPWIFVDEVIIR